MHILSVPRTGTHCLQDILKCDYVHTYSMGRNAQAQSNLVRKGAAAAPLVVPLRNPRDVWRSWTNRFTNPARHFEQAWRLLEVYAKEYELHFIPVDHSERDSQLAKLGKFESTWPKVGHLESDKEPVEADLDWIYEMSFIKRYY